MSHKCCCSRSSSREAFSPFRRAVRSQPSYLAYAINLDRRPDRLRAMHRTAHELQWQRISAVDGCSLSWDAHAEHVQPQALQDAEWAARAGVPTICRKTCSFSPHLTLSALGCALSHRAAWQRLVQQRDREWALVLEDDISGVAAHFEHQLLRLLSGLPATWQLCFLGYHESTGQLLCPADVPRAVEVPKQVAVTGLFGYMLTRSAASALLRAVFPLRCQVDVALNMHPWPSGARFACAPDAVLLTAPKSEEGACDTDVQTLGPPGEEAHRSLPKGMMRL